MHSTINNQRQWALRNKSERGEASMADKDTIFVLTREDVIGCAKEMGIPEEAITDDVLHQVRK
jgi:hypothetical protein